MGWGQTSFGGKTSNILIKGDLDIVSRENCNTYYTDDPEIPQGITKDQICAVDKNGERDTWQVSFI